MPSRCRRLAAVLVAIFFLGAPPASAAETNVSDVVLVDRGVVIDDDLYAVGLRAVVQGRIEGDLVVMVSEDVRIEGLVTGDVIAFAGSVVVTGEVEGSVRAVAPAVSVTGTVGGDVVVLSRLLEVAGDIGSDLLAVAYRSVLKGVVSGDVMSWTRHTTLAGRVGGDADLRLGRLVVREGASVGRDLGYRSARPAEGIELAEVGGTIVHRRPLAPNIRVRAAVLLAKLVTLLTAGMSGLAFIWAAPARAERGIDSVVASPWRSWGLGMAVLLSPLVVVALAGVMMALAPTDTALAAVAALLPFLAALGGASLALVFVSSAVAFPWLGTLGGRHRRGIVGAFGFGLTAVLVATLLPWVGWLAVLILVPLGVGGLLRPASS